MANYINPLNTRLDANQVLIRAYDEPENRLRVDAKVTAVIGSVDVIIDAASGDNIAISDGVDTLNVNPDGSINVIVQDITLSYLNDSVEVFQFTHDNLNGNANVQQNNVDVSVANPLFTQTTNGALENTQQQVLSELQTIDNSLDSIENNIDVPLSTRASEATQLANNLELQNINNELDTQTLILQNIDQSTNDIETRIETFDTGVGATTALNTLRVEANQGQPTTIPNAWPIKITDGKASDRVVEVVKENDSYSTSDHGLPIYGVDADTPRKYRPIRVDQDGDIYAHLVAPNANEVDFNAGTTTANTIRTSANITRNGNELAYNTGASNQDTLRTASNITDEAGNAFTDVNYLPVGQTTHDNLNGNANIQVNNIDVSLSNPVPVRDANIDVLLSSRATESTQLNNLTQLQNINTELDTQTGILTTIDNSLNEIEADADEIRLQTIAINTELDLQTTILQSIDQSTNDIETRLETFNTNQGPTGANTLRTSSNITDEAGAAFTDLNYLPVGQTTHDNLNLNANLQVSNTDVSVSNQVPTKDILQSTLITGAKTATTTQILAAVGVSNLANRKSLLIQNNGTVIVYYGPTGVTVSGANKGVGIRPQGSASLQVSSAINIFIITTSPGEVVISEGS